MFQLEKNIPGMKIPCPLTLRELEILRLFSEGMKNRQIAIKLFISYHTVRAHRPRIFKKLNANGKYHAVKIAECRGGYNL